MCDWKTTGQTCRYIVLYHGTVPNHPGVLLGHATVTRHDQYLNGSSDCSGTEGGDSGGPVYANTGNNTVIIFGLHSGIQTFSNGDCRYYFIRISGIKA